MSTRRFPPYQSSVTFLQKVSTPMALMKQHIMDVLHPILDRLHHRQRNSSLPVNDTSRPPTADATPIPASAKSSTATPATIALLDRRSLHSSIRPWTGAEDHELCQLKNDSKSRPSWKTLGQRLRRDPEVCKIRWSILKQTMPEGNPRHEPEAGD